MQPENIKIISSKVDRETKEGKIVIEVEEEKCYATPLEDLKKDALEHYEKASAAIHHWSSFIPAAIKAYNPAGYQLAKDSNQVNLNQNLPDKARDHAKEVEKFFSPTIEAYRLRAKNSFEAGYHSAKEIPQSVNLLAKFFLKERSESDPDSDKLDEMDDYFMQVYQKNTGNSFSFARLKAIEAVLIKYGYQLEKEIPDMIVGVWIKVSDKKPNSWDRVPVRFIHTQLPIYDGRVYAEQHPELIEWLEPIQLKDLLAK